MKYFLAALSAVLLVIIVGGAAFYFGQQSANSGKEMTTTPTPQSSQTTTNAGNSSPTPTGKSLKTVLAGGVLSFPSYSLSTPLDWNSQREQGQDSDKLTVTKLGYKITISEAAFGGGGCTYPGDPPQEMAQTFSSFVEITNPNGYVFRRGPTGSSGSWSVCQKNTTDGSFGAPTQFGHIAITTPAIPDASVMAEIDSILASIKKI